MPTESAPADVERESMLYLVVGMGLVTVGITFPADLAVETYARYGLLVAGVAFAAAGSVTALRAERDDA